MKQRRDKTKALMQGIIIMIILIVIVLPGSIVKTIIPLKRAAPKSPQKGAEPGIAPGTVTVYINSSQRIETMPLEEYVKGVVAAEMPASFEMEALKAQAVSARTYVYKRSKESEGGGCNLHPGADVCDDPTHCQAMISKTQMLKKWGFFSYYHYLSKVSQAVDSTSGMVIQYNEKPIDPLFFSTSNGKTENSEDVWDTAFPYLKSVVSPGEEISPRFLSVKQVPMEDVSHKLRGKWPDLVFDPKDPTKQWKVEATSTGGRISTLNLGGKTVRGTEIRALFDLYSTDIKWEKSGDNVKFTCKGYGHGVGMSQYGANAMAQSGSNYVDILKHYYTGIEVKKVTNK